MTVLGDPLRYYLHREADLAPDHAPECVGEEILKELDDESPR